MGLNLQVSCFWIRSFGLALAMAVGACATPASPDAPRERAGLGTTPGASRITVALKGDPPTLNDAINSAGAGGTDGLPELEQLVHAGLGSVDGEGRLRPRIAEAIPSLENGLWQVFPDGQMRTTWSLRPGARWHDGVAVTAEDMVFAARVAGDRQVAIARDTAFELIRSVEAPDPRTLVVHWTSTFIAADALFTPTPLSRTLPMPEHLLQAAFEEDRAGFAQLPFWSVEFVGAGPFRVRDWVLGSHIRLVAHEGYVLGPPKIAEVEVRFILDPSTMVANALAGSLDVSLGRGPSLEQALEAREQWAGRGRIEVTLLGWTALFPQFLTPNPPLVADITFRRALVHALDRQNLSDTLQGGFSPIAHSIVSPSEPQYEGVAASLVRYDFDPRKAGELLAGMGLRRGADGLLRDGSDQRIILEVRTTRDDLRERLIHPVGDYWRPLGIGMEPVIIATQAANDRAYRATFPAFELTRQPGELRRYHGSGIPTPENNFRGSNRVRYANRDFDALLDRYFTTIPVAERTEILGRIVHHMTDQLLTMGIFYTVEPSLVSARVANVTGRKVESGRLPWNIHEWTVQ